MSVDDRVAGGRVGDRESGLDPASSAGQAPDPLTFAELRLANMLRPGVAHELSPIRSPRSPVAYATLLGLLKETVDEGRVGGRGPGCTNAHVTLASVVICADVLAARIGIDLAAAIRERFEQGRVGDREPEGRVGDREPAGQATPALAPVPPGK